MIKIVNNLIPFKGFAAMTVWPLLFIRRDCASRFTKTMYRHEKIHARQQLECAVVALGILSLCGWIFGLSLGWILLTPLAGPIVYAMLWAVEVVRPPYDRAYRDIPLEREAYLHQQEANYLTVRRPFAWLHCLNRNQS